MIFLASKTPVNWPSSQHISFSWIQRRGLILLNQKTLIRGALIKILIMELIILQYERQGYWLRRLKGKKKSWSIQLCYLNQCVSWFTQHIKWWKPCASDTYLTQVVIQVSFICRLSAFIFSQTKWLKVRTFSALLFSLLFTFTSPITPPFLLHFYSAFIPFSFCQHWPNTSFLFLLMYPKDQGLGAQNVKFFETYLII